MTGRGAVGVVAVLIASACSGSDAGSTTQPVADIEQSAETIDGDLFTPAEGDASVVVSFDPVVETGVPGIESDDAFCRSWSEFAGSIQAVSLAWIVQSPLQAATLEVAAASALVDAVAGLGEHLPDELESNRQAFIVDVPTPTLRRAQRAIEFLTAAGVDDAAIEELGVAWIAALSDAGVDAEDLAIEVPAGAEGLTEAAESFVAALPSFVEDPSLNTTEFDISPSLGYISDNCPDQATLAGNDNIE